MRLRISGIEAGNAYLTAFMADYNRRFGVVPRDPADARRVGRELLMRPLCDSLTCLRPP